MADAKKREYYGFAVGIMLTTFSGLRGDFRALRSDLRTENNLKDLIRHNLYNTNSGVKNGELAVNLPTTRNEELEAVVMAVNARAILDSWNTLDQASDAVNTVIFNLLDYDGGSCPGYAEQPTVFAKLGEAGATVGAQSKAARR